MEGVVVLCMCGAFTVDQTGLAPEATSSTTGVEVFGSSVFFGMPRN